MTIKLENLKLKKTITIVNIVIIVFFFHRLCDKEVTELLRHVVLGISLNIDNPYLWGNVIMATKLYRYMIITMINPLMRTTMIKMMINHINVICTIITLKENINFYLKTALLIPLLLLN